MLKEPGVENYSSNSRNPIRNPSTMEPPPPPISRIGTTTAPKPKLAGPFGLPISAYEL